MKKGRIFALLSVLFAMGLSCCNFNGGSKANQPVPMILNGTTQPNQTDGKNGDVYIDNSTWDIYIKKDGQWYKFGNIKGGNGEAGVSIVSASIDENGDLIVVLSNGDEINAGHIVNKEVYTVTFDSNGGNPVPSQKVRRGDRIEKPADPVREGYYFRGWFYDDEYSDTRWNFDVYTVSSNMTLVAQWIAPTSTGPLPPMPPSGYSELMNAPEENAEYILGGFSLYTNTFRFFNGNHYSDEFGEYPYFLTTTSDVNKAVKIACHYVDEEFYSIQIVGDGEYTTYDGKYLELYEGELTSGEKTLSLRVGDNQALWRFDEDYLTNVMDVEVDGNIITATLGIDYGNTTIAAYDPVQSGSVIVRFWKKS